MRNALFVAALLALPLGACTPEGPQAAAPQTQCEAAASVISNPYATPGMVELSLEIYRMKCLGMTADGSRQLRAPVARNSSVNSNPASAPDDLSMFQQDMRAVPAQ
jgi:hypothetical protein